MLAGYAQAAGQAPQTVRGQRFFDATHGTELDLLYPEGRLLYPLEIKSVQTFSIDWPQGLEKFKC